ncbi:Na+/H+ antiporter NhaC family protein [candidate division KSB1 bacterium]|nr:Na+/H+ antiporter NhaC family protein [candidate division KSB1 bacterium]
MKRSLIIGTILVLVIGSHFLFDSKTVQIQHARLKIESPPFVLNGIPFELNLTALRENNQIDSLCNEQIKFEKLFVLQENQMIPLDSIFSFMNGKLLIKNLAMNTYGTQIIRIKFSNQEIEKPIRVIPGFISLFPPFLAIILALVTRQVIIALFSGIWLGSTIIMNYDPLMGLLRVLDKYLINSLADTSHVPIVIFSMTLGGMVGIISKSGGTRGVINKITRFANSRRGGQITTWLMGIIVFFDDYANTLIVGNTMRPFTDKVGVSREKLSYIVDSTAAPVASFAPISTWVGFQVALIAEVFNKLHIEQDAYLVFIQSIPYAAYSIISVIFVFLIGFLLRDFGPMLKSEIRTVTTGKVLRDGAIPLSDSSGLDVDVPPEVPKRWFNAILPILTVIVVTIIGLYYSGKNELGELANKSTLWDIIGKANSFHVLMWASFTGVIVAIFLAVGQKILTMGEAINSWLSGVKSMVLAMIILVLAWAIGDICEDLMTAQYVISMTHSIISPALMPFITFIIAALISFSTGTSWATMAILIPIVIPMSYQLTATAGLNANLSNSIILGTIGAVLSGSIFGDHSSPISDTTIMSSMSSAVDHIDHVQTQLPYALVSAIISCSCVYIPVGYGFNVFLGLGCGILLAIGVLYGFGKKIPNRL